MFANHNNQNAVGTTNTRIATTAAFCRAGWTLGAFLAVQACVYGQPADVDAAATRKGQSALKEIEKEVGYPISVKIDPATGTPSFIEAEVLHFAKPETKASSEAKSSENAKLETAREFLSRFRAVLEIDDPAAEWSVASSETDDRGGTHVRFTQTFEGLTVWPSELRVHLDPFGDVIAANGKYIRTPRRLNTKPAIDLVRAEAMGAEAVPGDGEVLEHGPDLIIFASPEGKSPRLAWKMSFDVSLISHWTVVIDANSGEVLMAFDAVCSSTTSGSGTDEFGMWRTLSVWAANGQYYMYDTSKPMFNSSSLTGSIGIYDAWNTTTDVWEVTSADQNSWFPAAAVGAAFNLSETYDYYLERHGRNSLDGLGGDMAAVVRYGYGFQNAFWNGQLGVMVFGDAVPFASVLDVVAHELSHGVTEVESGLIYEGQSGALNEAMSDIFGELVEARTYGSNDWLMAAELEPYGMGPMRSLSDPNSISTMFGPYPARMSQYVQTTEDHGGVHINSSIINHAFYLLAEGLDGGIGLEAAGRIFYRANTVYLTSSSQFLDARDLAVRSAEDIFGEGSTEARMTANAFAAVEIGDPAGDEDDGGESNDDEYEENDNAQSAANIYSGTVSLTGVDEDWFWFTAAPGEVTISIFGTQGDLDLTVLDAWGNVLGASTSADSSEQVVLYESQTAERMIRVLPYGGQGGDYQLTLEITETGNGDGSDDGETDGDGDSDDDDTDEGDGNDDNNEDGDREDNGGDDDGNIDTTCGGMCGNGCAMAMFASFAGLLGFSRTDRRRTL